MSCRRKFKHCHRHLIFVVGAVQSVLYFGPVTSANALAYPSLCFASYEPTRLCSRKANFA